MKLYISEGRVFYELGEGYLLYLCREAEYKKLSISQVKEMVEIRIREAKQ